MTQIFHDDGRVEPVTVIALSSVLPESAESSATFEVGEQVKISGISKGRGFQGVVKRHGFHGGRRSHGQKHSEREPGSIGGGLRTRVPKGMRMAGRMGGDRVTVKNLRIVAVNTEANQLLVSGAIPGRRGTVIRVIGNSPDASVGVPTKASGK